MRRSQTQVVDGYGLYLDQADGTWWLIQQGGGQNAIGLPKKECPFRIKTPLLMCPHNIDLSISLNEEEQKLYGEYKERLEYSPLLQFFDPVSTPKIRCAYVETSNLRQYQTLIHLQNLIDLSIGAANSVRFMNSKSLEVVQRRLNSSNLASYLLYEMSGNHAKTLSDLTTISYMSKGRLIFAGKELPMFKLESILQPYKFETPLAEFVDRCGDAVIRKIGTMRIKEFMRT